MTFFPGAQSHNKFTPPLLQCSKNQKTRAIFGNSHWLSQKPFWYLYTIFFIFLITVPLPLLAVFFHRNNDIIVSEMLCSVIVITHNHCCCSILIEMICGASKQSIEPNLTVCTHQSFMKINYIIINIVIICLLFKISFLESNWLGSCLIQKIWQPGFSTTYFISY